MFVPQIWFYGLAVVSAGVLQAHQRFLAAALAPLLSSVVVITAYLIFAGAPRRRDARCAVLGLGTTLGVVALALTTAVPLCRLGLRLRPRLRFAAGDRQVVTRIAAAGIAGLVLQQISVLLINYSAQRSLDPGALTRYTWANAIYLLPYAVLAAPLLQLAFPRLAAAADSDAGAVRGVLAEFLPAGDDLGLARRGAAGRDGGAGGPGLRARPGFGAYGGTGLADRRSSAPRSSVSRCWGWPLAPCWPSTGPGTPVW